MGEAMQDETMDMHGALSQAVTSVAKRHKIPYDEQAIAATLSRHAAFFTLSADHFVQLRIARKGIAATTNDDVHDNVCQLNYRAEVVSEDAGAMLLDAMAAWEDEGAGRNDGGAMRRYMQGVVRDFDTCASAVDGDPSLGAVKFWQFGNCTVEQLAALPEAPDALRAHLKFFSKHGLVRVVCTGVDMVKRSMNVYFDLQEGGKEPAEVRIRSIFTDLGFEHPDDATLRYLTGRGAFATSLTWDSEKCERVCFYMTPSTISMPPRIRSFMDDCSLPSLRESNVCCNSAFVSCSFGKASSDAYLKQESDWHGEYYRMLGMAAMFRTGM